jgi:hypothetical protein
MISNPLPAVAKLDAIDREGRIICLHSQVESGSLLSEVKLGGFVRITTPTNVLPFIFALDRDGCPGRFEQGGPPLLGFRSVVKALAIEP